MSFIILLFCNFVQYICNVLFFLLQELNVKCQTLESDVIPYNMTGQRSNKKIANEADNYAGTLIFDFTASGQELNLQEAI